MYNCIAKKKTKFLRIFFRNTQGFFASNLLFKSTYIVQLIQIFLSYNIEKHTNNKQKVFF